MSTWLRHPQLADYMGYADKTLAKRGLCAANWLVTPSHFQMWLDMCEVVVGASDCDGDGSVTQDCKFLNCVVCSKMRLRGCVEEARPCGSRMIQSAARVEVPCVTMATALKQAESEDSEPAAKRAKKDHKIPVATPPAADAIARAFHTGELTPAPIGQQTAP